MDRVDNSSLVAKLLGSNTAAIGMQVCAPESTALKPGAMTERNILSPARLDTYFSTLCAEIEFKSRVWRPGGLVRRLHYSGKIFSCLSKSDLTFITHTLSRYFKFDAPHKLICSIDLYMDCLKLEYLTLLRGLGFTSINLIFTADVLSDCPNKLLGLIKEIEGMAFKRIEVNVVCHELLECGEVSRCIVDISRRLSPGRIAIRSKVSDSHSHDHWPCSDRVLHYLRSNLLPTGYKLLPKMNNKLDFTLLSSHQGKFRSLWTEWKPRRTQTVVSLGCRSVSRVGNLFLANATSEKSYEFDGKNGVFTCKIETIPDDVRCSEWLAAHLIEQGVVSDDLLGSMHRETHAQAIKICEDWLHRGVIGRNKKGYNSISSRDGQREILAHAIISAAYPRFGDNSCMLFS